jgi:hypothetical protein
LDAVLGRTVLGEVVYAGTGQLRNLAAAVPRDRAAMTAPPPGSVKTAGQLAVSGHRPEGGDE